MDADAGYTLAFPERVLPYSGYSAAFVDHGEDDVAVGRRSDAGHRVGHSVRVEAIREPLGIGLSIGDADVGVIERCVCRLYRHGEPTVVASGVINRRKRGASIKRVRPYALKALRQIDLTKVSASCECADLNDLASLGNVDAGRDAHRSGGNEDFSVLRIKHTLGARLIDGVTLCDVDDREIGCKRKCAGSDRDNAQGI